MEEREYLREEHLAVVLEELKESIRSRGAGSVAAQTGVEYEGDENQGIFGVCLLGVCYRVSYPKLTAEGPDGKEAGRFERGMLLYYLRGCPEQQPGSGWLTLRELPGGRFYGDAFQGYTGDLLARRLGHDPEALEDRCRNLGGRAEEVADLCYSFQFLPRVRVAVALWKGDSEFEPRTTVLFNGTATRHLPTDALAGAGSRVVRMILNSS